jgi:hypothetical protein
MYDDDQCLAYAEHLQLEHRELHGRLRQMQAQLNNLGVERIDDRLRGQILEIGKQLRGDLVRHFSEEENGGCIDYACSRMPTLAAEARAPERAHRKLLSHLDAVLQLLEPAAKDAANAEPLTVALLKERFDDFVVRMLAHESRENRLVQRGFNMAWE